MGRPAPPRPAPLQPSQSGRGRLEIPRGLLVGCFLLRDALRLHHHHLLLLFVSSNACHCLPALPSTAVPTCRVRPLNVRTAAVAALADDGFRAKMVRTLSEAYDVITNKRRLAGRELVPGTRRRRPAHQCSAPADGAAHAPGQRCRPAMGRGKGSASASDSDSDEEDFTRPRHPPPPTPPQPSANVEVAALYVYPIKSCKGIALTEATVALNGFRYDRQWMVVTADKHQFLTQRQHPRMALIGTPRAAATCRVAEGPQGVLTFRLKLGPSCLVRPVPETALDLEHSELVVRAEGAAELRVPLEPTDEQRRHPTKATVWRDTVEVFDTGDAAAAWFSSFLNRRRTAGMAWTRPLLTLTKHRRCVPLVDGGGRSAGPAGGQG